MFWWPEWVEHSLNLRVYTLSSDHPPPALSLGRVLLSQLYLGPFSLWAQTATLLELLPSQCQSLNTHIEKGLLSMPFLPNCHTIFLSSGQSSQDTAWGRGCMVQALGEEWLHCRPPMLQSCDCSWRWHMLQWLESDSLFYRRISQFLSHWQGSYPTWNFNRSRWYINLPISLFSGMDIWIYLSTYLFPNSYTVW